MLDVERSRAGPLTLELMGENGIRVKGNMITISWIRFKVTVILHFTVIVIWHEALEAHSKAMLLHHS